MEDLLDAHVLAQYQPGRYTFHDLLREHALATAGAQEPPDAQREALGRLFDHYLHSASTAIDHLYPESKNRRPRIPAPDTLTSSPTGRGRGDQMAERSNARTSWPSAITPPATTGSHTPASWRPSCIATCSAIAHQADALALHGLALQASRRRGDMAAEARTLLDLGEVHYWWHGHYEQAAEHYRHALNLSREIGDQSTEARALHNLGTVYKRQRAYDQAHARDHALQALDLYTALDVPEADEIRTFLSDLHQP